MAPSLVPAFEQVGHMPEQRTIADNDSPLAEFAAELTPPAPEAEDAPPHQTGGPQGNQRNPDFIMRLPVTLRVVLGSATMTVSTLTKLGRGAVISLDRNIGDPVDVLVNGRLVARGEIVIADEATSRFGIKLTEVGVIAEKDK